MGHLRLGDLPKTRRWTQIMALLEETTEPDQIASKTITAAETGFREAAYDEGFRHTVWLLSRITLAARNPNFSEELGRLGLKVPDKPKLFDILGAFTKRIDNYLRERRARTDISEMAQLAAVETLSEKCMRRGKSLFGTASEDIQDAMKGLSTKKNFAVLARDFFSRFTYRYLNYFLSREVSKHVGPNHSLATIDEHTAFNEAMALHCKQSAEIVREFAGGWYSKTAYETGIAHEDAEAFAAIALKKLLSELKRGV